MPLPLMPKVTCSAVHPISSASKPEEIEMVACLTFMIHMSNESMLHSSHPYECHVMYDLSYSRHDVVI